MAITADWACLLPQLPQGTEHGPLSLPPPPISDGHQGEFSMSSPTASTGNWVCFSVFLLPSRRIEHVLDSGMPITRNWACPFPPPSPHIRTIQSIVRMYAGVAVIEAHSAKNNKVNFMLSLAFSQQQRCKSVTVPIAFWFVWLGVAHISDPDCNLLYACVYKLHDCIEVDNEFPSNVLFVYLFICRLYVMIISFILACSFWRFVLFLQPAANQ